MKTPFLTPKQAEDWRAAQAAPLAANDIPTPHLSLGVVKLALYGTGAVLLGIIGWALH